MLKLLAIAVGGMIGALLRYGVAQACRGWVDHALVTGTMITNILGCFAIGLLAALFAHRLDVREEWRAFLMIGMLGSFTTFSTFGLETFELAGGRKWLLAALNVMLSNLLGLGGVWLGYVIGAAGRTTG